MMEAQYLFKKDAGGPLRSTVPLIIKLLPSSKRLAPSHLSTLSLISTHSNKSFLIYHVASC